MINSRAFTSELLGDMWKWGGQEGGGGDHEESGWSFLEKRVGGAGALKGDKGFLDMHQGMEGEGKE